MLRTWHEATGLWIRDGYGQTETGQLTGMPPGADARPGSMGRALPGIGLEVVDGELVVDPATVPTFFSGYLGDAPPAGPWRTGDRVRADDEGFLYFEGRADDVIISAGYRIGPFEVESALVAHPAVAEAAVVAAPDAERGSVVRAVVVLRDGHAPSGGPGPRAPRSRQGRDGALQVPPHRRLRPRAAAHDQRQGPARGAAGALTLSSSARGGSCRGRPGASARSRAAT